MEFHQICSNIGMWILLIFISVQCGKYDWMGYDRFDEMEEIYNSADDVSCHSKSKSELFMRDDLVSQIPKFTTLKTQTWYKNRTHLIHLHNMALNRAFYYSYIFQKLNNSRHFQTQPNWMYMYLSVGADVNANPYGINASAIIFDYNCTYPNWYSTVNFNQTLPFFGPKAWRWEDYNDQDNFLREPTRKVAAITDIGAGNNQNYTSPQYKMNPWYEKWMPDTEGDMDSLTKFTYTVGLRYSNMTGYFVTETFQNFAFFGPSSPSQTEEDDNKLPVSFTPPYFDCGISDKWMFSATSPVIDFMPRYSNWTHLRRPRNVGVIVMDMDWDIIDYNACPLGVGNPGPSFLSGTDRCKESTECKHKSGYGFMRGGYECVCKPGKRYPVYIDPPYEGDHIEQATEEEYKHGFDCTTVDYQQVLPVVENLEGTSIKGGEGMGAMQKRDTYQTGTSKSASRTLKSINVTSENSDAHNQKRSIRYVSRKSHKRLKRSDSRARRLKLYTRRKRSNTYDYAAFEKMMRLFRQQTAVTPENCHLLSDATKTMPGSVAYGVDEQFESEGRVALRLAHFFSSFLQNTSPDENFGNLAGGGRLDIEHVFGEVIANVMSNDYKILSSGVFFDTNQFINPDENVREYFGPLAYKKDGSYFAIDTAGLPESYVNEDWYSTVKARWQTNTEDLKSFKLRPMIRSNPEGESRIKFEHFPLQYKAAGYTDGYWTNPKFKCDGRVDAWVMTYIVPFFGLDGVRKKIEFKGVVTVDVPLTLLEINQCPQPFHVANAFKNTARCDLQSTKCMPLEGYKFMRGSYRCDCKEGYEYMHMDDKFWIEGSLIELEYEKKMRGLFNRYDDMRCRIAGGVTIACNLLLMILCLFASIYKSIKIA